MDTLLQQYAALCLEEKRVVAEKKELQAKLEEHFGQKAVTEKTTYGTFKMVPRTTYEFSDGVKKLSEDLKMIMEDEKEQGVAIPTVTYGLRFNANK